MRFRSVIVAVGLATAGLIAPNLALAHVSIVASTPAENATVDRPREIVLTFSKAVLPSTAAASIVMTAMPGMANHGEMVIRNFTPGWSNDNTTLTLNLREPLRAGTYEVRWQATGADGHPMKGVINFTVR